MGQIKFTPTQQKLLRVLADGNRHRRRELLDAMGDDQATPANLSTHLCILRKRLSDMGETILCEYYDRTINYRHVRLIKG